MSEKPPSSRRCVGCGYDLASNGQVPNRCSECGKEYDPERGPFLTTVPSRWGLAADLVTPGLWSGLLFLVIMDVSFEQIQMHGRQETVVHLVMLLLCIVVALVGIHFTLRRVRAAEVAHVAARDRWPAWLVEAVVFIGFWAAAGVTLLLLGQLYHVVRR